MSLLKRIEQGQGGGSSNQPPSDNQGGEGSRLSSLQSRRVNAPITSPQAGSYFDLKTRVQNKLLSELDPSMDVTRTDEVRRTIQDLFEQILAEENIVLSRPERARLFEQIAAEILGFGPLQPLLEDDTITMQDEDDGAGEVALVEGLLHGGVDGGGVEGLRGHRCYEGPEKQSCKKNTRDHGIPRRSHAQRAAGLMPAARHAQTASCEPSVWA